MGIATVEFRCNSLNRTTEFRAYLPDDLAPGQKLKTLYLLHGANGCNSDWLNYTRIALWARQRNLAVIMPNGENSFYVDEKEGRSFYSKYICEDLLNYTRNLFPLSDKREDTFICGLSMGGYGAVTNGLKYWQTFGYIAGLSSAFRVETYADAVDGPDVFYLASKGYLKRTFGDLSKVAGSDMDYRTLALSVPREHFPHMYLCCGTEDSLLPANRAYHKFLADHRLPVTYEEGPGGHDWDFWNTFILKILNWLPLEASHH